MSGTSYNSNCPKCGGENLMCSSDWKPYDCVSGECIDCGFTYYTREDQMDLEEVNEMREDRDLKQIKKFKKRLINK